MRSTLLLGSLLLTTAACQSTEATPYAGNQDRNRTATRNGSPDQDPGTALGQSRFSLGDHTPRGFDFETRTTLRNQRELLVRDPQTQEVLVRFDPFKEPGFQEIWGTDTTNQDPGQNADSDANTGTEGFPDLAEVQTGTAVHVCYPASTPMSDRPTLTREAVERYTSEYGSGTAVSVRFEGLDENSVTVEYRKPGDEPDPDEEY